ncbi:MAG: peptidylprolyl isomerase [Clostridia bacterium]|nr:peptidylprolyl isomerase [Clostridia bacterium]
MTFSFTDANGETRTGDIVILLRPDCAPLTVANFKKLIFSGYYNGTEIFRVVNNRFIQGGEREDEEADYIKGEFEANGVENPLSHVRGTISMSRHTSLYNGIPAYDTASSCFFIMQKDYTDWDGKYAAFGTVVFGIEIIDLIADQELIYSERYEDVVYPKNPVLISSVSFVKPVN